VVAAGSKDAVELPRRRRVKEEREAEDVSTVTSGKVMVSAAGAARIVVPAAAGAPAPHKPAAKTRNRRSAAKKGDAVRNSTVKSIGSSVVAAADSTAGLPYKPTAKATAKRLSAEKDGTVQKNRLSLKRSSADAGRSTVPAAAKKTTASTPDKLTTKTSTKRSSAAQKGDLVQKSNRKRSSTDSAMIAGSKLKSQVQSVGATLAEGPQHGGVLQCPSLERVKRSQSQRQQPMKKKRKLV